VFAGIDGGGTKTAIVLVDEAGKVLVRHATTTSNAAVVGHDAAGEVLRAGMEASLQRAPAGSRLIAAWFGLSGSDRSGDRQRLMPFIKPFAGDTRLTNDAELILGALPGETGIAIVAGTGSIAIGRNAAGERTRAGGWGQVIGDEGSGYDLARRMFDAYARETDGRGPATSLTPRLGTHLGLTAPFQLIPYVYASERTKADLASLSRLVIDEAAAGDAVANAILRQAATELAGIAAAAARRLGFADRLNVALTGGLLTQAVPYRELVLDALRQGWPELEYRIVDDPALVAAQSLALAYRSKEHPG
jgi:N-acetylglucosamine kinase-like BadF-type ATPase